MQHHTPRSAVETLKREHRTTSTRSLTHSPMTQDTRPKLAPRSSLQFKIGPQFTPTESTRTILDGNGHVVSPVIVPRIDRGFELDESEWVGYKRNYFTLVSSFEFADVPFASFASGRFSLVDPHSNNMNRIKYFALRLISKCDETFEEVKLVQHTAKRDKGPQFCPQDQIVVPADLPSHTIIRESANVRNNGKIAKLDTIFFFDKSKHDHRDFNISGLKNYPGDKVSKVARFERVQFASSINFKKASMATKRFILEVQLLAYTDHEDGIVVAFTQTPPLIIRGRSPSTYGGSQDGPERSLMYTMVDSNMESTLGLSQTDSFGDFETYKILKQATESLSTSFAAPPPLKKKRGPRKPKTDQPTKLKKPKTSKANDTKSKIETSNPNMLDPVLMAIDPTLNQNSDSLVDSGSLTSVPSILFPTTLTENTFLYPLAVYGDTQFSHQQLPHTSNVSQGQDTNTIQVVQATDDVGGDIDFGFNLNNSADNSFNIQRLFVTTETSYPTFKKEPSVDENQDLSPKSFLQGLDFNMDMTIDMDMDMDIDIHDELEIFRVGNLSRDDEKKRVPMVSQTTTVNPSCSSPLVNFEDIDDFPSFSLAFSF